MGWVMTTDSQGGTWDEALCDECPDQGPYSSSIDGGTLLYLLPQGELGAASWPRAAPECWCYCSVLSIASSVGNCMMHPRQDWGQTLALGVDTCPDAR